jgi:predicted HTH domain antitoxin
MGLSLKKSPIYAIMGIESREEIATEMISEGELSLEQIARYSKLSIEKVKELVAQH